jgi:hypothetical protein
VAARVISSAALRARRFISWAGEDDRWSGAAPLMSRASWIASYNSGRILIRMLIFSEDPAAFGVFQRCVSSRIERRLYVRERRFVLHQDREDIAATRICNATRVRFYVTLSGVCVTVPR